MTSGSPGRPLMFRTEPSTCASQSEDRLWLRPALKRIYGGVCEHSHENDCVQSRDTGLPWKNAAGPYKVS
jgi:hypothetical protein